MITTASEHDPPCAGQMVENLDMHHCRIIAANNVLHKPTLYLSKFIKRNQKAYYECLYDIHAKGDYETWIKFFLAAAGPDD